MPSSTTGGCAPAPPRSRMRSTPTAASTSPYVSSASARKAAAAVPAVSSAAPSRGGGGAVGGGVLSTSELVEIARGVAGDDEFTEETPLLELNSLELLELHARLEAASGRSLPRALLLEQPTLGARCAPAGAAGRTAPAPAARRAAAPPTAATAVHAAAGGDGGQDWDDLVGAGKVAALVARPVARARQRLLFLHGEGASAALQRGYLERTGWLDLFEASGVEVVLIDAPEKCGPKENLVPPHALAEYRKAGVYYSWGGSADRGALRAAMRHVSRALRTHAPIDGIGGFSQGALLAATVAASGRPPVRWLLSVCGMPWQWLHVSVRTALPSIGVPSLHLVSDADAALSAEQRLSLPARCEKPDVVRHASGHALPRLDAQLTPKLRDFLARAEASTADTAANASAAPPRRRRAARRRGGGGGRCFCMAQDGRTSAALVRARRQRPAATRRIAALRADGGQPAARALTAGQTHAAEVFGRRRRATASAPRDDHRAARARESRASGRVGSQAAGAAYSQGLVLVDGGKVLNNQGLPYNLWEVVANIRGVQATGCHCHRHRLLLHLHHLTSSIPSLVQAMHGRVAVTEAGSDVRYNCECFLVEELVKDGHEKYGT